MSLLQLFQTHCLAFQTKNRVRNVFAATKPQIEAMTHLTQIVCHLRRKEWGTKKNKGKFGRTMI